MKFEILQHEDGGRYQQQQQQQQMQGNGPL